MSNILEFFINKQILNIKYCMYYIVLYQANVLCITYYALCIVLSKQVFCQFLIIHDLDRLFNLDYLLHYLICIEIYFKFNIIYFAFII